MRPSPPSPPPCTAPPGPARSPRTSAPPSTRSSRPSAPSRPTPPTSLDAPARDGSSDLDRGDLFGEIDAALSTAGYRPELRRAVAALPERERTILALRFFGDLTQTQIAERVGLSQMHVSRLLSRTLGILRERLDVA